MKGISPLLESSKKVIWPNGVSIYKQVEVISVRSDFNKSAETPGYFSRIGEISNCNVPLLSSSHALFLDLK